jgi:hypothetical protein
MYKTDKVYTFSEGGLFWEAAIGTQKVRFRPAVTTTGQEDG